MMKRIRTIFFFILLFVIGIFIAVTLYAIPATLTLSSGPRPGIEDMTIDEAVDKLKQMNIRGFELVEETRKLIITRMQYCRRNSFDSFETAFQRGYGYCIQQAFAMEYILHQLGITATVVQAMENRFIDNSIGGHSWVRVEYNGIVKDVDPTYVDLVNDKITFTPLSEITEFTGVFKYFTLWGSAAVNAHRYYTTGKDF